LTRLLRTRNYKARSRGKTNNTRKELNKLRKEVREAIAEKDREAQKELAALKDEYKVKIRREEETRVKLRVDRDQLRKDPEEQ
jgi:hypothetical protein